MMIIKIIKAANVWLVYLEGISDIFRCFYFDKEDIGSA